MRIHTDVIAYTQELRNALQRAKDKGRIADHVLLQVVNPHRSRTTFYAYEVQLAGMERDRGRRAGNSGSYGGMDPARHGYAATYDEWGWFLAELFAIDKKLIVGSAKTPIYYGADDFHEKTGLTYNPEVLLPLLEAGHWPAFVGRDDYDGGDPYPYRLGKNQIGRRGAGRSDGEREPRYFLDGRLHPRTPDWYRAFAAGEVY